MNKIKNVPGQVQDEQPGDEHKMDPQPEVIRDDYKGSDKLKGKVALISGGDSGIGRSVAVHFAREGANVAIIYLEEDEDAQKTVEMVKDEGHKCLMIKGDIRLENFCKQAIRMTIDELGSLDILVNNAAQQYPREEFEKITAEQIEKTFKINIFPMFYLSQSAEPHLSEGGCIINTTSVTAFRGSGHLIDYASTKGAITAFTRSLAKNLSDKKIRVNAIAPGPIWTPLIPASFGEQKVEGFGEDTLMERPGQPSEVAPGFVYLASADASYITGQVIHINGGQYMG